MDKKTVLYPIEVPAGKYCKTLEPYEVCQYFNNLGGYIRCDLDIKYSPLRTIGGGIILKPKECLELKEAKDDM